ncbi:hypothetical protein IAG44_02235 [Streptomyces roseirectus]|uniref:MFS transporter n=1 Tax=Streptomyces roseirectus TaxID=2768066 RepID=A0A7H0I6I9_9ACTN|nr:MFS transporter [Streptomyces roseirectus]QNP68405.1 hypothetical protein IAG44_02235 [Streptomyces roseirectus]
MKRRYGLARYLLGAGAARTGDEMSGPALLLTGTALTGSAATGSALLAALTASAALGGPFLGALLDRTPHPGRLLAVSLAAYATTLLLLRSALDGPPLPAALSLALLAGVFAPALASGWTSRLPHLTTPDRLPRATALDAASYEFAALAGPALAGGAALVAGPEAALLTAVGLIVAALPAAWTLPGRGSGHGMGRGSGHGAGRAEGTSTRAAGTGTPEPRACGLPGPEAGPVPPAIAGPTGGEGGTSRGGAWPEPECGVEPARSGSLGGLGAEAQTRPSTPVAPRRPLALPTPRGGAGAWPEPERGVEPTLRGSFGGLGAEAQNRPSTSVTPRRPPAVRTPRGGVGVWPEPEGGVESARSGSLGGRGAEARTRPSTPVAPRRPPAHPTPSRPPMPAAPHHPTTLRTSHRSLALRTLGRLSARWVPRRPLAVSIPRRPLALWPLRLPLALSIPRRSLALRSPRRPPALSAPRRPRASSTPAPSTTRHPLLTDLRAGCAALVRIRPLARATFTSTVSHAGLGAFTAVTPVLGARAFGSEGAGAFLLAVLAGASLAANLALAHRPPKASPDAVLLGSTVVLGVAFLLAGAWPLAGALVAGLGTGPQLVALFGVRNREAPERLRGQIFTTGASLKTSGYALGAGAAVVCSTQGALLVAAGCQALAVAGFLTLTRRADRPKTFTGTCG